MQQETAVIALLALLWAFCLWKRFPKLDDALWYWDNGEPFTLRQAIENIAVFGQNGSGKTTGIDQLIAKAMMIHRFGMLISAPKPGSADQIEQWARDVGQGHRVLRVVPDGKHIFNFISWAGEKKKGGHQARIVRAVDMLREARECAGRGRLTTRSSDNEFFETKGDGASHAIMTVDCHLHDDISADRCLRMIQAIPATAHDAQTGGGFCKEQCEAVLQRVSDENLPEVRRAVDFLMVELAGYESKVKSSILATATASWEPLLRPPLDRLVIGKSTVGPRDVLNGKIVIIDLGMASEGSAASMAFSFWKRGTEMELLERRGRNPRPCSIFVQEASRYLSSYDSTFSTLCRESRSCLHISLQSLNGAFGEIGGDATSQAKVKELLGTIGTKVYAFNQCIETNRYASEMAGERRVLDVSASGSPAWSTNPFIKRRSVLDETCSNINVSVQTKWVPRVRPDAFHFLERGGPKNKARVGAIVCTSDHKKLRIYRCLFDQNIRTRKWDWPRLRAAIGRVWDGKKMARIAGRWDWLLRR